MGSNRWREPSRPHVPQAPTSDNLHSNETAWTPTARRECSMRLARKNDAAALLKAA